MMYDWRMVQMTLLYPQNQTLSAIYSICLYTGWWFQPLWKILVNFGWLFPIYGKIKNVPNHQPVYVIAQLAHDSHLPIYSHTAPASLPPAGWTLQAQSPGSTPPWHGQVQLGNLGKYWWNTTVYIWKTLWTINTDLEALFIKFWWIIERPKNCVCKRTGTACRFQGTLWNIKSFRHWHRKIANVPAYRAV